MQIKEERRRVSRQLRSLQIGVPSMPFFDIVVLQRKAQARTSPRRASHYGYPTGGNLIADDD
jgi:hypothetical protein